MAGLAQGQNWLNDPGGLFCCCNFMSHHQAGAEGRQPPFTQHMRQHPKGSSRKNALLQACPLALSHALDAHTPVPSVVSIKDCAVVAARHGRACSTHSTRDLGVLLLASKNVTGAVSSAIIVHQHAKRPQLFPSRTT